MITGNVPLVGTGTIICYNVPSPPTNLSAINITTNSAAILFTTSSAVTGVYVYSNITTLIGTFSGSYNGSSSINITGLTESTTYILSLIVFNSIVKSKMSATFSFSTQSSNSQIATTILQLYQFNTGDTGGPLSSLYNYAPNNLGNGYLQLLGGSISTAQYKFGNAAYYCPPGGGGVIQAINGGNNASYTGDGNFKTFPSSGFTVSLWVYPTSTPSGKSALYMLYLQKSSTISFTVSFTGTSPIIVVDSRDSNGNFTSFTSNSSISYNTWTHIAVTVSTSNVYTIYVNGSVDNSVNSSYYPNTAAVMTTIGSGYGFNGYFGYMDQVISFNTCYSASIIQSNIMNYVT